ncbi:asparaginase [Nocardioides sp. zg-1228]|uniref:asparaginase n=1 Tax=Nocardioides sp. zg-1228 TaxID=2763008 RepID=UPI0016426FA3|nr:asparaginase [Nocardioides sp. zg-1228]MBC2931639.1 asparaginase [Nocardioides sp. zg-1228]QSF57232.1 asparaginase [Nocardioides sp. zg-1228]
MSSAASTTTPAGRPVVAEIVRSGFVEGHHYGSIVALTADGAVDWSVGAVDVPVLPRSSNKPVQALAMVELGLDLPDELLALACASHSGEEFHVEGVRRTLASAGLDESALRTPADYPLDDAAREAVVRAGGGRAPILMNCSGKHAAMLATCVLRGWDTETYLDPTHPLQVAIADTFARLTGEPIAAVAVDGCGAPLLSTSLTGLARAFAALATADDGPARRVADAIRRHPEHVSGTTRDELALHRAVPGLIGKAGAESCYAVALPDGRAWALKTDDGAARVRPVLMAEALRRSGVLDEDGVDAAAVRTTGRVDLLGGGVPVGEIRAVF